MMKLLRILLLLLFLSFESTLRSNAEVTQEGERFRMKLKEVFDDRPESELVFVLDSSGSVSVSQFKAAVDFVNISLTLISVSASTTRVAVISYSSCEKIYTSVDYISSSIDKNKCTFGQDLRSVEYDAGGTCTAEALQRGREVLTNARPGAQKVLMLLTDGSSNDGGSPTPNAELLKGDDVLIFTIGIGNINIEELNAVATNVNEYKYILANFGDVSKLATVTKLDIKDFDAYFDIVQDAQCDRPCDDRAVCTCATRSGSTGCACEAGFTGDGNSCQECPIGTYKTSYGNGPCDDCPMHSTTTSARSSSRSDCYCGDGYEGNPGEVGGTCQLIRCPDINNANGNGVIMDDCDVTFYSTCQFQCRDDYRRIAGDQQITCFASKQWSGTPLQCEKITCPPLPDPNNAVRTCNTADRSIGTACELQCEPGYEFKQDAVTEVTCQRDSETTAQWSADDTEQDPCKKVSCPPLSVVNPLRMQPAGICLEIPRFGQMCTYDCKPGYQAEGTVDTVTCQANGTWDPPAANVRCRDNTPPVLICPDDISNPTDPFMSTCRINWELPDATDNTGVPVKLRSTHSPPYRFDIGTTTVMYSGTDLEGNMANCSFTITVRDEEPPRIGNCNGEFNAIDPGLDPSGGLDIDDEDWNTSIIDDNSGSVSVDILGVPSGSNFPLGESEVVARATDSSGNSQDCNTTIIVSNYFCPFYPPPLNGAVACANVAGGQHCRVSCKRKFHFTGEVNNLYACVQDANGKHFWSLPDGSNTRLEMPWPDCASPRRANAGLIRTGFRFTGPCLDSDSQNQTRINFVSVFEHLINTGALGPCSQPRVQCTFDDVVVQCGQTQRRNKRQAIDGRGGTDVVEITFTLRLEMMETVGPDFNILEYVEAATISAQDSIASGNVTLRVGGIDLALSDDPFLQLEYSVICEAGHVPSSNGSCVPCAPGTFENMGVCERCPVGTFQDQYGNTTCRNCPADTSTANPGAKSAFKCKSRCRPGTYSMSGVESCSACPIGTYEPDRGSTECNACPDGLTTWTNGNTDVEYCTNICPRGTFSPTGFAPCQDCPKGTYQPRASQTSCTLCPGDKYTHRERAHAIQYCQIINECESNPCADGATCVDITRGYECVCPPGFTGDNCELDIDECYGNDVCLNNGTCINLVNAYVCECANGFMGENCQININDCLDADCRYGSTCVDGIASYTCACAEGFAGEHCEINLYDCASDPCQHGGSCIDLKSNFSCCCAPGYTGRLCELTSDHCRSSPCHGDATCTTSRNSYTCTCPPGFRGRDCEINIDECQELSITCQNGGTCEDAIDGYNCICPLGFNGRHCQTELPKDYDLSFPAARTADRVALEGVLPDLYEFTLAFWMKTSDQDNFGTPISYATRGPNGASDVDNTITLLDYNSFVFFVNGQSAFTYQQANSDANWHFIAVTWTSETGAWAYYLDGSEAASGTGLSTGTFVKGRGIFILGQDQDTYNGSYVAKETFIGSLSQVNIWDYAMTGEEVRSLRTCCSQSGNALSWAQLSTGLRGALRRSERSEICNVGSCGHRGDCRGLQCQQGGECTIQNGHPICQCPDGFTGRRCQFDINECSVNNGGCTHQCQNTIGSFVCSCRQGYALQPDQKTCNSVNFCKHYGKFHSAEDTWEEDCAQCSCQNGRSECVPKPCPRLLCQEMETEVILPGDCCPICMPEMKTCSMSNSGNYETFDKYVFDQHGECRYLLTRDYSGTSNFEVHVEHQFIDTNQTRLGIAVFVYIDCVEVKITVSGRVFVQDEVVSLPYAHRKPANVRIAQVGDGDIEVFSNKGLTVTWSQSGGVRLDLTVTHRSGVQGLCGNMNGNKKDDKMTRQGISTSKNKELLHSWKVEGYKYCKQRNTRPLTFGYLKIGSCSSVSFKDFGLAFKKCRVLLKKAFKDCNKMVDPKPYITNCIEDACTCGVRQPCHCEAVSSYNNECHRQLGQEIQGWRKLSKCALECPSSMVYDECGPPCQPTCSDPDGERCAAPTTACVAGCHCLAGQVLLNGACISRRQC